VFLPQHPAPRPGDLQRLDAPTAPVQRRNQLRPQGPIDYALSDPNIHDRPAPCPLDGVVRHRRPGQTDEERVPVDVRSGGEATDIAVPAETRERRESVGGWTREEGSRRESTVLDGAAKLWLAHDGGQASGRVIDVVGDIGTNQRPLPCQGSSRSGHAQVAGLPAVVESGAQVTVAHGCDARFAAVGRRATRRGFPPSGRRLGGSSLALSREVDTSSPEIFRCRAVGRLI